jgi:hypothetical protein
MFLDHPDPEPQDPYVLGLPNPHRDPLVRGTDPKIQNRIRIRTNMSRIPNTASYPKSLPFIED